MSYDASIIIHTGKDWVTVCDIGNYTSNVHKMYSAAMQTVNPAGLRGVSGMPCSDAATVLREAIEYFDANADSLRAMNPANGWGCYEDARWFLGNCLRACEEHPSAVFDVG